MNQPYISNFGRITGPRRFPDRFPQGQGRILSNLPIPQEEELLEPGFYMWVLDHDVVIPPTLVKYSGGLDGIWELVSEHENLAALPGTGAHGSAKLLNGNFYIYTRGAGSDPSGMFRSSDGGLTFDLVKEMNLLLGATAIDRASDGTLWLYADEPDGPDSDEFVIFKSEDNGETFERVYSEDITVREYYGIACNPVDPNMIALVGNDFSPGGFVSLWDLLITTNRGGTWSHVVLPIDNEGVYPNLSNNAIFTDTGRLVAVGQDVSGSTEQMVVAYSDTPDEASSWQRVAFPITQDSGYGCDPVNGFALSRNPLILIATPCNTEPIDCTFMRMDISIDNGETWRQIPAPPVILEIDTSHPADPCIAIISDSWSGIYFDRTSNILYAQVNENWPGSSGVVYALADPTNESSVEWLDITKNLRELVGSSNTHDFGTMMIFAPGDSVDYATGAIAA